LRRFGNRFLITGATTPHQAIVGGLLLHPYLQHEVLSVPQDRHRHIVAGWRVGDGHLQRFAVLHGSAAHRQDHIACLQTGLGGRRLWHHRADQRPAVLLQPQFGRQIRILHGLDADADVAPAHAAVSNQLLLDQVGQVAGDRQADALESAGPATDGAVHADHLAVHIHQWPTRVARIDGRVGLQEILVHVHIQAAVLRRDDPVRHGARHAERGPHSQHAVTNLHLVAVAQRHEWIRALGRVQPHDGQVGLRVGLDIPGDHLAAVLQHHQHLAGPLHHMGVGQHHALAVHDHA